MYGGGGSTTGSPTRDQGYNSTYGGSAFSMDPREEKSRKNWRLINQAKAVMARERHREEKITQRANQLSSVDKTKNF